MTVSLNENSLITQVDGDAPIGLALRQNWIPVVLSVSLEPDGAPERVRILGKNFVAWRSTDGRLGFFDEHCPHRRTSLALARNEDNALRCIFHGWKFSVSGVVVEVPTEPRNAAEFCKGVPLKHYPVVEAAGIVWVWLGRLPAARLPEFEFMKLPPEQVYPVYQKVKYNWIQSVEGGMDAAHVAVLHQDWLGALSNNGTLLAAAGKLAPIYEFEERGAGFRYAAIRNLADGRRHIRINEFVIPWYCFIAAETGARGDRTLNISVPIDDVNTIYWTVRYNPFSKLGTSPYNPVVNPTSWPPNVVGGPKERWGQDRDSMRRGSFSGFSFPTTEDFAVAGSQGAVADRSREYLSSGDRAVLRVRRLLLDFAASGKVPGELSQEQTPDYAAVRPMSDIIPAQTDWRGLAAI